MKKYLLLLFLLNLSMLSAQSVYVPLNSDYNYLVDRYEIKSDNNVSSRIFSTAKPFLRKDIAQLADTLLADKSAHFSTVDEFNLKYLQDDNWEFSKNADAGKNEKMFLKNYYEKKNAFYQFKNKDFEVQFNPVVYFSYGKESASSNTDYINTRGIELRGAINKRIGFYTFMVDNQAAFPLYVNNIINTRYHAVPGEGFWKSYRDLGYDFYTARGYITFDVTKNINTQFGQDKNFIGNGYRSLMLSDFSNNYLFLRTNINVWKFQYTTIFAKMVASSLDNSADVLYPTKYMALHYLSFNFSKKFSVGFFESITFGNHDSTHNRGFDASYLNPIVFYKGVENYLGAPDKAHVGIDWKWNFLKHFSHYGNILLDEFLLHEVISGHGWWGNKQAIQLGLKYIDVAGIDNLDMQLETNVVRPYTYTYYSFSKYNDFSYFANYTNYNQPLAHPSGANFYELIGILRYQPLKKVSVTGKLFYQLIGLDGPGQDWGSNVMLAYTKRQQEYGNTIAQGVKTHILFCDFTVSYQLKHNMFIDLKAIIRKQDSELEIFNQNTNFLSMAFRWNIPQRLQEF